MQTEVIIRNKVAVYKLIGLCQKYRDDVQNLHKCMLRLNSLFYKMTTEEIESQSKKNNDSSTTLIASATSDKCSNLNYNRCDEGLSACQVTPVENNLDEASPQDNDLLLRPKTYSAVMLDTAAISDDVRPLMESIRKDTPKKFHFYKNYGFHLGTLQDESRIIAQKLHYELKHISLKIIIPMKLFDKQCTHYLKHCPCGNKIVTPYEVKQVDKFIEYIPKFWHYWFLSYYSIFYRIHFLLYLQSCQLLLQKSRNTVINKSELSSISLLNDYREKAESIVRQMESFNFTS